MRIKAPTVPDAVRPTRLAVRGAGGGLASGLALLIYSLAALAVAGCSTEPTAGVIVRDEVGALDAARIEAAAAPLVARGAIVAIVVVDQSDDSGADLSRRLRAERLQGSSGDVVPLSIALYVSNAPRQSHITAGRRWSQFLPPDALRTIREDILGPALRSGQPGEGVAATLGALDRAIAAGEATHTTVGTLVTIGVGLLIGAILIATVLAHRAGGPRKVLGRLWLLTPPGRWQARRRTWKEVELARRGLIGLSERAADRYRQSGVSDDALEAERTAIEGTRTTLDARPADDPGLLTALHALSYRYGGLAEKITQSVSNVQVARHKVDAAAERAARILAALRSSLEPAQSAVPLARHIVDLEGCEQQRARLSAPGHAVAEADLEALAARYAEVETRLLALWRSAKPEDHGAFLARGSEAEARLRRTRRKARSEPGSDPTRDNRESAAQEYDGRDATGGSSSDGGPW